MTRRQIIMTAAVGTVGLAALVGLAGYYGRPREDDDDDDEGGGQEALSRALLSTNVNLQQGLAASEEVGQPIAGKFELQHRKFQLFVYTSNDGKFSEVLVDPATGKVARVEALTRADELATAQSQSAAMVSAKTSLKAAVDKASAQAVGFQPVGIIPNLKDGRPVATVLLLKGEQSRLVNVALD